MKYTRKQNGGVALKHRKRRLTRSTHRRRPSLSRNSYNSRSTRSRNASNIHAECNSIYSALNSVPEDPTKTNEQKNSILARLQTRLAELGCGDSGRLN